MDDVYQTNILGRYEVPRHRLTTRDYHRLGEAGILGEDDRVELLEGQLVDMSPIGPRHALAIDLLNRLLPAILGEQAWLRVQNPIVLDDASEPQPDFAVVRHPWSGYPDAHPRPPDILLLIEVADSSLEFDLGAKLELYARAGICEFWVVDLTSNRVLVHRSPREGRYDSITGADILGTLGVEALPGLTIAAAQIFV
ncbi:MAG TPA: Uma2 family endonuclease [Acetobacteraceae bacterium]|jgi:Uma2 family endonuclease